jgi:hypothetical protein
MARTILPPDEFHVMTWTEIGARADEIAALGPQFRYLTDLVASIRRSGVDDQLAASYSMMDLRVTDAPVHEPPVEYILVRAPNSTPSPPPGMIRIEHQTSSGRNDAIDRPYDETVPLFWRFIREKFGVVADL